MNSFRITKNWRFDTIFAYLIRVYTGHNLGNLRLIWSSYLKNILVSRNEKQTHRHSEKEWVSSSRYFDTVKALVDMTSSQESDNSAISREREEMKEEIFWIWANQHSSYSTTAYWLPKTFKRIIVQRKTYLGCRKLSNYHDIFFLIWR